MTNGTRLYYLVIELIAASAFASWMGNNHAGLFMFCALDMCAVMGRHFLEKL